MFTFAQKKIVNLEIDKIAMYDADQEDEEELKSNRHVSNIAVRDNTVKVSNIKGVNMSRE